MARKSYFDLALGKIQKFFAEETAKVYDLQRLGEITLEKKTEWNLPDSFNLEKFKNKLVKKEILTIITIVLKAGEGDDGAIISTNYQYLSGPINPFLVAVNLKRNVYLSHYSAMVIHGLTNQLPKTLYITKEQSPKERGKSILSQSSVDGVFSRSQRKPSEHYEYEDYKCFLLKGMHSNRAGVTRVSTVYGANLPITNIERTLIDIVVRPYYSGGVTEILKAYERAADSVSVNKMKAIFSKLDFVYPYHQAIGFYLERSGRYKEAQIDLFFKIDKQIDFYLAYGMKEMEYDSKWRIYYPKGL